MVVFLFGFVFSNCTQIKKKIGEPVSATMKLRQSQNDAKWATGLMLQFK